MLVNFKLCGHGGYCSGFEANTYKFRSWVYTTVDVTRIVTGDVDKDLFPNQQLHD